MEFVAGWNMPGYLPEMTPEPFDEASDALDCVKNAALDSLEQEDLSDSEYDALEFEISSWELDENGEFETVFLNYAYFVAKQ